MDGVIFIKCIVRIIACGIKCMKSKGYVVTKFYKTKNLPISRCLTDWKTVEDTPDSNRHSNI